MQFLELPRLVPSDEIRELARETCECGAGLVGTISSGEAAFLMTALQACKARRVVEIGVASGLSSRCILALLEQLGPGRTLFAFDALDYFYGDAAKKVGYLASESPYNHDGRYALFPGATVVDVAAAIGFDKDDPATYLDAAFIDGDHRHPWATLDFLALLSLVKEGGAFIFHDVNLPFLTGLDQDLGPKILFEHDFAERHVLEGPTPNIGSLIVRDRSGMVDKAIAGLDAKWETTPNAEACARIVEALSKTLTADQVAAVQAAIERQG